MRNITKEIKLVPHFRHNKTVFNCIIMEHRQQRHYLPCGQHDEVHAFQYGVGTYVLNINREKGYLGLNSYMPPETGPINSMFLHGKQDIENAFGADWVEMDPEELATVLLRRLY